MKRLNYVLVIIAALSLTVACNKITYKKTKSGLAYKLFHGNSKDSLIRAGVVVKYNVEYKLNDDSVLFTSYDKAPQFVPMPQEAPQYNIVEIFPLMRKGDSAIAVLLVDTLQKQQGNLPPAFKKGDRVVAKFRIVEVFTSDSLGRADYSREMEKDKPRQMKEQEEQMAKMKKQQEEARIKEEAELEKSGEIAKELQDMQGYLAAKKINAQKTGKGTFVYIQQQGTGRQAENNKYVNVKYTGKILTTDSTFQSNTYAFKLGNGEAIRGWDEGLLLFKEGGKGTLFIPGFLAYGANPGPGSPFKPFEALKFDIELLQVSDTPIPQDQRPQR